MSAFALKLCVSQGAVHRETVDVPSFYETIFDPFCQAVRSLVPDADIRRLTWEDAEGKQIAVQNDKDLSEALSNTRRAEDGKIVLKIHVACADIRDGLSKFDGNQISASISQFSQGKDPAKIRLIQQQLVLLLHAHKCKQLARPQPCGFQHCATMKEVLTHMTICKAGRECPYPHCASSRQIIVHWKNCTRQDCEICAPLKQVSQPCQNAGGSSGAVVGETKNVFNVSHKNAWLNLGPITLESVLSDIASVVDGTAAASSSATNIGLTFAPQESTVQKEWHTDVTHDLRAHLVAKIAKAIFPHPDPTSVQDQRVKDLIAYSRKVEKEMFETADDREAPIGYSHNQRLSYFVRPFKEQYYLLLAERLFRIGKELQEKRQKRLEQQQAMAVRKEGQDGGSASTPQDSTFGSAAGSSTST